MIKKAKIISLFTALILCFAVACCFIGCGDDTFGTDGIKLSASSITVEEGKSTPITALVIDQTIEWEIEDDTIVSVTKIQPGVYSVTGLKEGTTTITAKAGDKSATCTVTVKKAEDEDGGDGDGDGDEEITITLSATELSVEAGKTAEITVTVSGTEKALAWEIEDEEVVSVTAGEGSTYTVAGLKEGETTITAKVGAETAECTVTVTAAEQGGDEGDEVSITLSATELSVEAGKTAEITATVSGTEDALAWEIGDEEVVSVTAGEGSTYTVAGLKEGTTTITAKVGEKTATCTVTVTAAEQGGDEGDEVSITLSATELSVEAGKTAEITATVSGTEDALAWEIGDEEVVSVTAGEGSTYTVAGLKEGTTTITAKVGEKTATCTVTVTAAEQGGDEGDKNITVDWSAVGDPIYGEVFENNTHFMYHHLFFNDAVDKAYDFDGFDVTVKLDGVEGEIVGAQALAAGDIENHTYHLHIRIKGTKYQTAEFTISFKKDGEVVAIATYKRDGDREVALDSVMETVSVGDTATINITSINGSTDLTGKTITWTIADTEGEGVATIPADSTGTSVEVTAVAVGKATLTCTVGTGDDAFSKTCAITVVEGEVVIVAQDLSAQMKFNNKFQTSKEAIQLRCELQGEEFAELVQQIDVEKTTVEVTMDGAASTSTILQKYWDGAPNLYVQIEVESNWEHGYEFRFSFKNAKGDEVAYAVYTEAAPKVLNLDNTTLNLTLKAGETVTGTITATKNDKVEGDVSWTIDDDTVATISVSDDGLTVTVTAVGKGSATVTATADDLTKTCTVNVLEDGEEAPVITITDFDIANGPYGDGRFYQFRFNATDANASHYADIKTNFDHTDVDGATIDHKEFFEGGGVGCYIVVVHFPADIVGGQSYKIDVCDASGNILATFTWTAPINASLDLDNTRLELTLKDGETVTATITATKEHIDSDIAWTIDDPSVATISVSEDKLSVTVTAVAKGTATITATADGLEKTCKVTVLEDGEVVEKPQSTYEFHFEEVYGAHYMHFSGLPTELSFNYVKVYKNNEVDGTQRWSEFDASGHLRVYVTEADNAFDGDWKFEFYKDGEVVATLYFTYPA